MNELKWLDEYSGETTTELIALEGEYEPASLVLAFEEALYLKIERAGQVGLCVEELVVLVVEALEREVNNGGYHQLFSSASNQFAAFFVNALDVIGCAEVAAVTQEAIDCLDIEGPVTPEAIGICMEKADDERDRKLRECGDRYFKNSDDIARSLLEFIKCNREKIVLVD